MTDALKAIQDSLQERYEEPMDLEGSKKRQACTVTIGGDPVRLTDGVVNYVKLNNTIVRKCLKVWCVRLKQFTNLIRKLVLCLLMSV